MGLYYVWSAESQSVVAVDQKGTGNSVPPVEKAGEGTASPIQPARQSSVPPIKQIIPRKTPSVKQSGTVPPIKQNRQEKLSKSGRAVYFAVAALLIVIALAHQDIAQLDNRAGERLGLSRILLNHQVFLKIKDVYSNSNAKRPNGMIALSLENLARAQNSLSKLRDTVGTLPNPPKQVLDYLDRLNRAEAELSDTKSLLLTAWARSSEISDWAENHVKGVSDEANPQAVLSDLEQCKEGLAKALDKFRLLHVQVQEAQRNIHFASVLSDEYIIATMGILDNISKASLAAKESRDETTHLLNSIKHTLNGERDEELDPDSLARLGGVLLLMPDQGLPAGTSGMGPVKRASRRQAF